jgi:hypothetical protein
MSKRELLIDEIKQVPESLIDEVLDFVHFLKTKVTKDCFGMHIARPLKFNSCRHQRYREDKEPLDSLNLREKGVKGV